MINNEQREKYLAYEGFDWEDYAENLAYAKAEDKSLSWKDISLLVLEKFGVDYGKDYYARHYRDIANTQQTYENVATELKETILELQKERVKVSDERAQNRAYIRRMSREEVIKEIAKEAAQKVAESKPFLKSELTVATSTEGTREGILLLSDWHYGIEINNYHNVYNPQIAIERIQSLVDQVLEKGKLFDIKKLHILNLGDLIAGRIHSTIRLESRIDTLTQIMNVSEILAEALMILSQRFEIEYYSCTDNHSRIEPIKAESLDLESLCRITDWYLKERLYLDERVHINDNNYGDDIISFNVLGHNICGVHGDKDSPAKVIASLTNFTKANYDLVVMAHRHHFSADEECSTLVVGNGSVMGTDNYATKLRLHATPSQTLVVVSEKDVAEYLIRVTLD